ncbi:MAG: hypothetical protein JWL90_2985 [Chthoniobacteraceae bacterium]|nr:hypothetical protein [Chthoniobacteraceae bacterium]
MCDACSAVLEKPERKRLWLDQKPLVFTSKVSAFQHGLARAKAIGKQQETPITGEAAMKERQESALEKSAAEIAGYLFVYFRDAGQEDQLPKVDLSLSEFQRLRDQQLIQRAQVVYDLALPLTLGEKPSGAAHGIDAELLRTLQTDLTNYDEVVSKPKQARATKKTQTSQVTDASAELSVLLKSLDKLIVRFRGNPAGDELVESWFNARRIDSIGRRVTGKEHGTDATKGGHSGTGTNIGEGI